MLKRIALALGVVVALCSPALSSEQLSGNFTILYDLDATAATYCKVLGSNGSPFGPWISGVTPITTSGSSATTTEVADTDPFTPLSVSDVLMVDKGTGTQNQLVRALAVKGSASSVTVNAAWDIENGGAGYVFGWKKTVCGTAATDGWIGVAGWDTLSVIIEITQLNVTDGIDIQIQCKGTAPGSGPVQVFPSCTTGACNTYQNYTTAGVASATAVVGQEPWGECRVGMKIGTADDGGDLTTNAEQVTIGLLLEKDTR